MALAAVIGGTDNANALAVTGPDHVPLARKVLFIASAFEVKIDVRPNNIPPITDANDFLTAKIDPAVAAAAAGMLKMAFAR